VDDRLKLFRESGKKWCILVFPARSPGQQFVADSGSEISINEPYEEGRICMFIEKHENVTLKIRDGGRWPVVTGVKPEPEREYCLDDKTGLVFYSKNKLEYVWYVWMLPSSEELEPGVASLSWKSGYEMPEEEDENTRGFMLSVHFGMILNVGKNNKSYFCLWWVVNCFFLYLF